MNPWIVTPLLLVGSNVLMTFAWYGHLKAPSWPLWLAVLVSWGIAFFEYCLAVPANRIGYGTFTGQQLKVMQEVITIAVFGVFSVTFLGRRCAGISSRPGPVWWRRSCSSSCRWSEGGQRPCASVSRRK